MKRKVFYSFHYDKDVMRVQQVRNIGVIEGDEPVTPNQWETIKRGGEKEVEKWINDNMKNKDCVIVLVGSETSKRKWVLYEIKRALESKKALFGIYIHNLKDPQTGRSSKGENPFSLFTYTNSGRKVSDVIPCYDPNIYDAYNDIADNLEKWVEKAIRENQ